MGYRVVDTDSVEPEADRPCECRKLTVPAGLSEVAVNRFRAAHGERIPFAYHSHETQEGAFHVPAGTLAVETPDETDEVESGDLFAVEPGSPERAHNPVSAAGTVEVLAIGAPPVGGDAVPYESDEGPSTSADA